MNIAYRFRIYPTEEQKILLGKTFGCCRFLYNQMLNDKIREYKKTKKLLKNTPAMYKKEYSFLKEVDSLALANVQLHLEKAYKNFFRDPKVGFPRFKSKHHSKNSYTTNVVNGNILVEDKRIRLPKLKWISMKKHREPAENCCLKSVTVSMEPSGKYFASLLYEGYSCENQAADEDYSNAKILGIDYAMQGMAVFSEEIELEKAGFFRRNEKRLAREQRKLSKEEIDGVGIGVPGPVNERGEVPCAVNLFWGFKEVTKELTELTGLPSKAGNDANVAALGEAWKGAAAGAKNVILVTLGTGVGGGIIVDGKIVGGAHGAGGEIGHAAVDHEEKEACNCGNCGCLEQYASATGIVRVAQRTLAATDEQTVLRKFTKLSAKNVLDAFKEGDKVACDVMAQVGEMLGGTLAMFACVTDPEAIVIGGGVSKAGQPLIDCIQKYYEKYAFTACKKTPIILATLGNDAGIYGSARMVIKEV